MMNRLLHYASRHHIFFPRGFEGKFWPQLNPYCSSSHGAGRKRTWRIYEPLWMFRLRKRLFCFAGHHVCPENSGRYGDKPDSWYIGMDGNRTCSYCGSIHVDDLEKIIEKSKTDPRYGVSGTTKCYKVYVQQPNVKNAGEGAIKFYGWHGRPK